MKKYIITGGQGFIGSKIIAKTDGLPFDLKSGQDILNTEQLQESCEGAVGIFHCAAKISVPESIQNPDDYYRTNVEGTQSVVNVANAVGTKIVFSSSCAVYGESDVPVNEDALTVPKSPYAQNKLDGEKLLSTTTVPSVALRYFNVYGPGQSTAYAGVIKIFIESALDGKDLIIFGDGTQSRDFIFVDDVAEANVSAMNYAGDSFQVINIASGKSISMTELAEKIIKLTESSSKIVYLPAREGDIKYSQADVSKAMNVLGWKSKVSLDEGLVKTIESIKALR